MTQFSESTINEIIINAIILSYYICMEFVVIASWISYWVLYDSIPGRMSPIVTVLLAIINGLIGISGDFTPGESSISMFEIYILGALFQVLLCKL